MNSITYHQNDNLFVRFQDHAKLGLAADIGPNRPEANLCEKTGNHILKLAELPVRVAKEVARKMQDPRYVTVGLTATALLVNSGIFYPIQTKDLVEKVATDVVNFIKRIDLFEWTRFGSYVTTCVAITGFGLRAEGRFSNEELMKEFYGTLQVEDNPAGMIHAEILANR